MYLKSKLLFIYSLILNIFKLVQQYGMNKNRIWGGAHMYVLIYLNTIFVLPYVDP